MSAGKKSKSSTISNFFSRIQDDTNDISSKKKKKGLPLPLRNNEGSGFFLCPICFRNYPLTFQSHVDTCRGSPQNTVEGKCSSTWSESRSSHKESTCSSNRDEKKNVSEQAVPSSSSSCSKDNPPVSKSNAFHLLRKGASQQFRTEIFSLWRTKDNKLEWSWTARGSVTGSEEDEQRQWVYRREVKLPGTKGGILVLRTNIASSKHISQNKGFHMSMPDLPVSVEKSALQKNVRLSRGLPAVRVALQLLLRAPAELYRRLPIIMFEDGMLHPACLVLCTWLMMATAATAEGGGGGGGSAFVPDHFLVSVLLRVVFEVAVGRYLDFDSEAYHSSMDPLRDETLLGPESICQLPPECQTLVRCILARRYYGGMGGDVHMLRSLAKLWILRFLNDDDAAAAARVGTGGCSKLLKCPAAVTCSNNNPDPCAASSYISQEKLHRDYLESSNPWCRILANLTLASSTAAAPPLLLRHHHMSQTTEKEYWPPLSWRLGLEDIPLSSVDFHVSNVVEDILSKRLSASELQGLRRSSSYAAAPSSSSEGNKDEEEDRDETVLVATLRTAMWQCASSLTDKVSLVEGATTTAAGREQEDSSSRFRQIWKIIKPHAEDYALSFLKRRMASSVVRS